MKVGELIKKAHLYTEQKITIRDYSTMKTFVTLDRYCFEFDPEEVERICKLRVNSFDVSEQGITIHAE